MDVVYFPFRICINCILFLIYTELFHQRQCHRDLPNYGFDVYLMLLLLLIRASL